MKTVAIFGVGLIGGSFALALRKSGFSGRILGVSSARTLQEALSLGVIDQAATLELAAADADLIYLAQPIHQIVALIRQLSPRIRPGTLVTDAGSTKSLIAKAAREYLPPGSFIGGHPMAGKETRGVAGADASLFQGRNYVLTPLNPLDLETGNVRWLRSRVEAFGSRIVILDPDAHDRLVAFTSHLPQLISTALSSVLAGVEGSRQTAGPAVIEMTRVAMSPFDMWSEIFDTNQASIDEALSQFIVQLEKLRGTLAEPAEMAASFDRAAAAAKRLRSARVLDVG